VHACYPGCSGKHKIGGSQSKPVWVKKKQNVISKISRAKRDGGMAQKITKAKRVLGAMAQVAEHLP
jgi:hypothetical protein